MPRVVIIGGGISGLSTAWYLRKAGIASTIVESRPRLGGVIQTERIEGCIVEGGPDSFLAAKPAAMELIRDAGLGGEVIGSNDHLRVTYVRKSGRLIPLPDGLTMMVPTKILPLLKTPLLSWRTKLRMGLEYLLPPKAKSEDESVADFVREHYGQEAADYLAEPLLSGVYGGDPEELSARAVLPRFTELADRYGSLTRGVLASRSSGSSAPLFQTLRGGLQQLVDALSTGAEIRSGRAEAIERGRVRIAGDWIEAEHIVVACEAHCGAALLSGRLAELLAGIGYSSSMIVAMGYDTPSPPGAGFGFLVPKKERRSIVACTWVGTKFAYRVPEGKTVARCFVAGDVDVDEVARELQEITGWRAKPSWTRVFQWPRSMAQYQVGHGERMAEIRARLADTPGLHLAGNGYEGIGIPDCIRMGKAAADTIVRSSS